MTKSAKHIGYNVVAYGDNRAIEIVQSLSTDDNTFCPAQSIVINGIESIMNLRDFCHEICSLYPPTRGNTKPNALTNQTTKETEQ